MKCPIFIFQRVGQAEACHGVGKFQGQVGVCHESNHVCHVAIKTDHIHAVVLMGVMKSRLCPFCGLAIFDGQVRVLHLPAANDYAKALSFV